MRVGLKEGDVVMVGLVDLVKLLFVERRIIVPTNNPSRAAWPWEPAMLEGGLGMGRYGEGGDKGRRFACLKVICRAKLFWFRSFKFFGFQFSSRRCSQKS